MCLIQDCNIIEIGYTTLCNTERRFSRNVYLNYNELFNFFKTHTCIDSYCSAYLYSSDKISEAELYGNLYLDFDDDKNLDKAREDVIRTLSFLKIVYQIPNDQVKIYFSGHKGFHLIVPGNILGVEPDKNLNNIFKVMAEQIKAFSVNKTIDLKIYDNRRLFRMPNTINGKTGLYKVILTPEELYSLSEDQIKKLASKPRNLTLNIRNTVNPIAHNQYLKIIDTYNAGAKTVNKNHRFKKKLNVTPYCIQSILENGASEGSRNITIACLTSFFKESGKSLEETMDEISTWNSRNAVPTPYREMQQTIKSIFFSDKTYGCSTLKTLVQCNPEKCKLKNKQQSYNKNSSYSIRIPDKE